MRGHIRQRGKGTWELKFDLGRDPLNGKRQSRFVSFKGTKRDAQTELTRLLASSATGDYIDPSKVTVAEFLDRWARDWVAVNVSPKTGERYHQLLDNQVKPHIGALPIQKLRPVHLSELYAKLLRQGGVNGGPLSARSVGHTHRCLRRALGHATQWGVITTNPAWVVGPPKVQDKEIEIIRKDELRNVLAKLRGHLHVIATLALATGMRRGELLALRWQDVDLDAGVGRVERSLEQTRSGLRFKAPKTKHGRRSITLPSAAVAELRAHRKAQQEQRLALGLGKVPDDALVFPASDGQPRKPNALTNEWIIATTAIGRRLSLHALRHTHASSLIAAGIDILTISRRLGHAKAAVTLNVYGHLYGSTDDRAAQVIEAMFTRVQ
jgi:integrase